MTVAWKRASSIHFLSLHYSRNRIAVCGPLSAMNRLNLPRRVSCSSLDGVAAALAHRPPIFGNARRLRRPALSAEARRVPSNQERTSFYEAGDAN
jgi:hypothetical protein